jgi:hypothetical protein
MPNTRFAYTASIPIPQQSLFIKRSQKWAALRKEHLAKQPECQACGKSLNLQVHHIIPLHIDKTRELDPDNLITLCENVKSSVFCHYTFGHLGISWLKYDPNIIENARQRLNAVKSALG